MNANEIDEAWVVEWHPKGDVRIRQVRQMLETNRMHFAKQERSGYLVIDFADTMEQARRLRVKWLREKNSA